MGSGTTKNHYSIVPEPFGIKSNITYLSRNTTRTPFSSRLLRLSAPGCCISQLQIVASLSSKLRRLAAPLAYSTNNPERLAKKYQIPNAAKPNPCARTYSNPLQPRTKGSCCHLLGLGRLLVLGLGVVAAQGQGQSPFVRIASAEDKKLAEDNRVARTVPGPEAQPSIDRR